MLLENAKDKQFFTLLTAAAKNIGETANEYLRMVASLEQSSDFANRIHDLEHKGDQYTHDLISLLNRFFITPLEREDILTLACKLDDVTDALEAAASRLHLYKIRGQHPLLKRFGDVIAKQATEMIDAMEQLQAKNLGAIHAHSVVINTLENEGDSLLRESLEDLFEHETNPIMIIKLKEIYETLESATDRAEDVANALESIIMKNS